MSKQAAKSIINKLSGVKPPRGTMSMSIRIAPDTYAELTDISAHLGVSVAALTRQIIEEVSGDLVNELEGSMNEAGN